MSARDVIEHALRVYYQNSRNAKGVVERLLTQYDSERRADRDREIMRWLGKKAREYRATGSRQHALQADTIELMAWKISRGAVRPDNTRLPAGVEPKFFEPGRTYQREHHGQPITFVVRAISTSPDGQRTIAHGWRTDPYSGWEPTDSDDLCGWTDVTEGAS